MQERPGPGGRPQGSVDRSATSGYRFTEDALKNRRPGGPDAARFSELTGRMPVVPKRPPGMSPRIDAPPPTPRIERPLSVPSRRRSWRAWLVALIAALVAIPLIWVAAIGVINFVNAVSISSGPATTAADFLANISAARYDQAYQDLGPSLTILPGSSTQFIQAAMADDHCFGQITKYQEVANTADISADQTSASLTYTITRSKLKQTYQLTLQFQKDNGGNWRVSNYGSDLGPSKPACS